MGWTPTLLSKLILGNDLIPHVTSRSRTRLWFILQEVSTEQPVMYYQMWPHFATLPTLPIHPSHSTSTEPPEFIELPLAPHQLLVGNVQGLGTLSTILENVGFVHDLCTSKAYKPAQGKRSHG